jgi:hypothetical protein
VEAVRRRRLCDSNAQQLRERLGCWRARAHGSSKAGGAGAGAVGPDDGAAHASEGSASELAEQYVVALPSCVEEYGLTLGAVHTVAREAMGDFGEVVKAAARQRARAEGRLAQAQAWRTGRWRVLVTAVHTHGAAARAGVVVGDELLGLHTDRAAAAEQGYAGPFIQLNVREQLRQVRNIHSRRS